MTLPGRGETVGEAYIRLRTDGSSLPRQIREDWDKANPEFEDAGKQGSKAYHKGFDEETDKHNRKRNLLGSRGDIERQRGRMEATGKLLGDSFSRGIKEQLEKSFGKDTGSRIFTKLSEDAARAGDFKVFKRGLKRLAPEVARANAAIIREEQRFSKIHERALIENDRRDVRFAQLLNTKLERMAQQRFDTISKLSDHAAKHDRDAFRRKMDDAVRAARAGDRTLGSALLRDTERFLHEGERGFIRLNGRIRQGIRPVNDMDRAFGKMDNKIKLFGTRIGRVFGKGSRNNFFNAFGALVGGATTGIGLLGTRFIRGPLAFATNLRQAWREGDTFASKMKGIASVLGGTLLRSFAGVGKLALGVAGAFGALLFVVGPLIAAISLLAGAIVALASTIIVGLIGAVGAALPIMGVFAAGIGVIALAFAKMGSTSTKWKNQLHKSLAPVTAQFKQLQDVARKGLFGNIDKQAPKLASLLKSISPIVRDVSKAISTSWTQALTRLNGPIFQKNFKALDKFAPGAILKLGHILTNVFGQLTGVMRALIPTANKLLNSLVKSSDHWLKFINSAKGQNAIKTYFANAWKSAQKLYATLRLLVRVLVDLTTAGRSTGNTMFDNLNNNLQRFDTWMKSGQGRTALRTWFADTLKFMHALGQAIGGIGNLFDSLDNKTSRAEITGLLTAIGGFLSFIARVVPSALAVFKSFGEALQTIGNFIGSHHDLFQPIILSITTLWLTSRLFGTISGAFGRMVGRMGLQAATLQRTLAGVAGVLSAFAGGLVIGNVVGGAAGGGTKGKLFGALSGAGIGALTGAAAGAPFGGVGAGVGAGIGALVGGIGGLIGAWHTEDKTATAALEHQRQRAALLKQAIEGLTNAILADNDALGANTRLQVANDLQKGGALSLAQQLGINLKTLTSSVLGNAGAQARLTKKIGDIAFKDPSQLPNLAKLSGLLAKEGVNLKTAALHADRLAEAEGKLAFANRSVAAQTLIYGHSLSNLTVSGRQNVKFIHEHIAALTQELVKGKLTGGQYAKNVKALRDQLVAYKFNVGAIKGLIAQYGNLPKSVITKLLADPKIAKSAIGDVLRQLNGLPPKKNTDLNATDKATPVLNKFLLLENQSHDIRVQAKADVNSARQQLQDFLNQTYGIDIHANVILPSNIHHTGGGGYSFMASGRVVAGLTRAIIGEQGPEAVVPLRRPLAQVDPSVRWLSAIAQGQNLPRFGSGGIVSGANAAPTKQIVINNGGALIHVTTPTTDPLAVAAEFTAFLAAGGHL